MFPTLYGALTAGGARSYATILRDDFGASEVWPLVDIVSGTTIPAFVDSARNGTLSGWDLQNAAGPVPGTLAPLSGTGDHGNVMTANLASIFDPNLGSVFIWGQNNTWAGTQDLFRLAADLENYIRIFVSGANIGWRYEGSDVLDQVFAAHGSPAGFISAGMSWDAPTVARCFFNGSETVASMSTLGEWVGPLALATIGAFNTSAVTPWVGHLAYAAVKFGSIWTPAEFAAMHTAAATAGAD